MVKLNTFQPLRKAPTAEDVDQQVRQAAKQMEGKFLEEMVKQMRSTVHDSEGFIPTSNAEKIFREQLDQQYVSQWGDKGGIGLADLIYNQIMDKYGAQMGLRRQEARPQGPIQIRPSKEHIKLEPAKAGVPSGTDPQKSSFLFDLQKMSLENPEISSPWSGQLTEVQQISPQEFMMQLKHSNGLSSQMVFRGLPEGNLRQVRPDNPVNVEAGQRLGVLSPEAKSFIWTVDVSGSV